jgi:GPI-anchor transamidase subunit T
VSIKKRLLDTIIYLGYGQEYGSMIIEMTNYLSDRHLSVLYVEVLPWFIRPYLHTMKVDVKPEGKTLPREPG